MQITNKSTTALPSTLLGTRPGVAAEEAEKARKAKEAAANGVTGTSGSGTSPAANGVTGTAPPADGSLGSLELVLPSAESVETDRAALGSELQIALGVAGIRAVPPIDFKLDQGEIDVDASDPRRQQILDTLKQNPDLSTKLKKLVSDAQFLEHGKAQEGWYKQVNAGVDPDKANQNLLNAAAQIDKSTGFTLKGDELTLEASGLGEKLMDVEKGAVSDDEKMWKETLRLTDRRKDGLIRDPAQVEQERKQDEKDGHGLAVKGGGKPALNADGGAGGGGGT